MGASSNLSTFKALDFETRALIFNHLATMENAGVPALQSFQHLKINEQVAQRVAVCRRLLNKGKDIAHAGNQAGLFDYFEFELLRAANAAGGLGVAYKRLAKVYTEKFTLQKRLKARMRLPMLMFVLSLFLLRIPALVANQISNFQFILGIVLPIILLFVVVDLFKRRLQRPMQKPQQEEPHTIAFDRKLLQLPIFGKMIARDNARQFYESLSLLLEAGVAIFEAAPLACNTIWNAEVRRHFAPLASSLVSGYSLSTALESNTFKGETQVIDLIRTGEESGCLPEMLWRYVESENEAQTQFREQLADWAPKIMYSIVAVYIMYQIFRSGAFMPQLPPEAS